MLNPFWLTAVALTPTVALAAVVSIPASKDAMIFGTQANVDTGFASGKGPALFAGADGQSNKKRSLLKFDVASAAIPANATITGVTMTLYLGQIAGSGGGSGGGTYPSRTIRMFDLAQDWGEGSSGSPTSASIGGSGQGYPRVAGDSSWDYAFYDSTAPVRWNASGTDTPGGNFNSTEAAASTFTTFTVGAPYTWSSAGLVSDVQAWLAGTRVNNGWLLKSDLETSPTSFLGFWSRDGAAASSDAGSEPPALSITYSVPEPASAALLGVAILCVRRARRDGKAS